MNCPCGSENTYNDCCGTYISGKALAPTAEKLMRSRYTAHVKAEIDYIKDTMIAENRKQFDPAATKAWATESKWKGLKIVSTKKGGPDDQVGVVEFVATYERNGKGIDHHEISEFRKDKNGAWLFVDGEGHEHAEGEDHNHHEHPKVETVKRTAAKIGRNDPCTCGSGKKYKKCCEGKAV